MFCWLATAFCMLAPAAWAEVWYSVPTDWAGARPSVIIFACVMASVIWLLTDLTVCEGFWAGMGSSCYEGCERGGARAGPADAAGALLHSPSGRRFFPGFCVQVLKRGVFGETGSRKLDSTAFSDDIVSATGLPLRISC